MGGVQKLISAAAYRISSVDICLWNCFWKHESAWLEFWNSQLSLRLGARTYFLSSRRNLDDCACNVWCYVDNQIKLRLNCWIWWHWRYPGQWTYDVTWSSSYVWKWHQFDRWELAVPSIQVRHTKYGYFVISYWNLRLFHSLDEFLPFREYHPPQLVNI